jgi:hypothetical protein
MNIRTDEMLPINMAVSGGRGRNVDNKVKIKLSRKLSTICAVLRIPELFTIR